MVVLYILNSVHVLFQSRVNGTKHKFKQLHITLSMQTSCVKQLLSLFGLILPDIFR